MTSLSWEANRQTSRVAEVTSVKRHNEIFKDANEVPEKQWVVPTAGHYLLQSLQNHKQLFKKALKSQLVLSSC